MGRNLSGAALGLDVFSALLVVLLVVLLLAWVGMRMGSVLLRGLRMSLCGVVGGSGKTSGKAGRI